MTPLLLASSAHWKFRDATARSRWRTARVPGCVHLDLRAHGLIPDPFFGVNELAVQWIEEHDWEYRAVFNVPAPLLAEEFVELAADGLDTVAVITLNGRRVARTDNMFVAHRWNVKSLLRAGRNELRISFASALRHIRTTRQGFTPPREWNELRSNCVRIRKQQSQFGWDWGPRLVTAGIWGDLRLEGWTGNRLSHMHVNQHHRSDGSVELEFLPEFVRRDARVRLSGTVSLDGHVIAEIENQKAKIRSPSLWWPNGHGAQPLYTVTIEAHKGGRTLDTWSRRIGLRRIVLDRHKDQWGESFRFVVNGRPIFAKGANWIPAHSFVARLTRADYERDLRSAAAANMNMLRAWGGGIYESETFYDLCDELGLLVWQDFMFACALYPSDRAFLASVRTEATQQVKRLHHRACLALWCGNNESAQIHPQALAQTRWRRGYESLFHRLLPAMVGAYDGVTAYWPSSEWRGDFTSGHAHGEKRGDTHFWDVWHARRPVKDYEKWAFRFVSEFGMQSYSSPATNATFCPSDDNNVFGPTMENHQKNRGGNQVILDYVSRRYRMPKDQDALIYLSQLNQAFCMQTGVEHLRRLMPRSMGALYWQLNDCWPVASWSSIEFTGHWKALHCVARRFFAPALVTAHVPGDEVADVGNYRRSTVREVHIYTVYDAATPAVGQLRWNLFHVDGRIVLSGRRRITLRYGESVRRETLDLAALLTRHGRDNLYLRIALDIRGATVSEDTVFLAPPRFLALPRGKTKASVTMLGPTSARITFRSQVFHHRFAFELAGEAPTASDNYFDLYPGEKKSVLVEFSRPTTRAVVLTKLRYRSLADSYV